MLIEKRIENLVSFGKLIAENRSEIPMDIVKEKNPWFEPRFVDMALDGILEEFLDESKLESFISRYQFPEKPPKHVGLILAGNIPLVSFHDIMMVYLSGHIATIKASSKDDFLTPLIWKLLEKVDPGASEQLHWVDKLKSIDAVIATGSDNSFRYFDHYFKDVPSILRRNRTSVAILKGNETDADLDKLVEDMLSYFGLGCRNVSHLLVPEGFDMQRIFMRSEHFSWLADHQAYRNNHDYRLAMYIMNRDEHLANGFFTLRNSKDLKAPLGVVHYHHYSGEVEKSKWIAEKRESIQCVVGKDDGMISFGSAQKPAIDDFADGVDVVRFLLRLFN